MLSTKAATSSTNCLILHSASPRAVRAAATQIYGVAGKILGIGWQLEGEARMIRR